MRPLTAASFQAWARPFSDDLPFLPADYWIELAAEEKTLLAFEPTRRIVPTTNTRITASITAYSAISWPSSSLQILKIKSVIGFLFKIRQCSLTTAAKLRKNVG
jgi:hypothetical protein